MFKNPFKSKEKHDDSGGRHLISSEKDMDIFWMARELEFQHQPERLQFRTDENHPLKLGVVVNSLFDIRKEELSILTINDGELTIIEGQENIWDYEFLQHYKRNENGKYSYYRRGCNNLQNQIILTLSYRAYYVRANDKANDKDKSISKKDALLIIHLQYPLGLKNKTIYIQATFCLPTLMLERGARKLNEQPGYLSILIGYDYRSHEEVTKEFDDMMTSTINKFETERFEEMSYVERELLELSYHPIIAKEYYSGKKVMAEDRFWDAIKYFNNVVNALQQKWWEEKLTEEEFEILAECSFNIGYCYFELGLYEKSYKFLEFSVQYSESYKYAAEYINCLIALRDPRSFNVIEEYLESLIKLKVEERTKGSYEFLLFLIRRKCYCYIDLKLFDEAEKGLQYLLSVDPENQYAKNELEYIRRVREK